MSKDTTCITIRREAWKKLSQLVQDKPYLKLAETLAYAVDVLVDYYRAYGAMPQPTNLITNTRNIDELSQQAADLPGMTAEVIQSHLVRFPKVTPEAYKGIIEELRQRQQSEEGLKNPEAAAYGLCKRIQNGGRKISAQQENAETNATIAQADNPFAVY